MAPAIRADNLRSFHTETAICMSSHRPRDRIEVGGPAASRFKLVVRFVEGCVAGSARINAGGRHVLVVFASEGGFGAFFAEHAELFYCLAVSFVAE